MNKIYSALGISMLAAWFCAAASAQGLPMETVFKGRNRYDALVAQMKARAEELRAMPIGRRTSFIGRSLVGTPYRSYTLEIDDHIESPSVNFNGLDCWTFFETSLALARMVDDPVETWTPEKLLGYIELDRYIGGKCTGSYVSRLHYLEEWSKDNESRGLVKDLTRSLGGRGYPNAAREMTVGWKSYRYMAKNPGYRSAIADMEERLRRRPLYFISKDKVLGIENQLQSGDIISIVSKDGKNYGTSHVGLAYRSAEGVLHFMHASSPRNAGKVVIDSSISEYLHRFPKHAGIMVARPLR